jgi:uncharacterized protein YjbI with pentapeptide repeats
MHTPRKQSDGNSLSISLPDLPLVELTSTVAAGELRPQATLEDVILRETEFAGKRLAKLKLQGVRFLHVRASNCDLDNLRLRDALHDSCDWANASWNHAQVHRCVMEGCRMTGFTAGDARFEHTRFSKCKLDLSVFHRTEFTSCWFEQCILHDASFEEARLIDVVFRNCDLRNARLARARLERCDLRGSMLEGLQAEPGEVRGVLVEPSQAIDLVRLMGVRIQKLEQ